MIPEFDSSGNLPAGIYSTTLTEIEMRFATNPTRRYLYEKLKQLNEDLKNKIGCKIIYIDGSFVTKRDSPGDIDVCWDNTNVDLDIALSNMPILWDRQLQKKMYACDIFPAFIHEGVSGKLFLDFFQCDKKTGEAKGILKINL